MRQRMKLGLWLSARIALFVASTAVLLHTVPGLLPENLFAATNVDHTPRTRTAPASTTPVAAPTATLASVRVHRELDIPRWLGPGEFAWNDEGAPAGPTIIVVNLRARVLSAYRAGVEIGRSSLIYGHGDKPTPTGTFPILEMDADHHSNLYNAPMPHMLRLTWDGVSLHGSPELRDDLVTHGCVGLPREFAALLFRAVRVGDQVIIWDGERSA